MATHQATLSCSPLSERYLQFSTKIRHTSVEVTSPVANMPFCANHRLPQTATCKPSELCFQAASNSAVFPDVNKSALCHRHSSLQLSPHQFIHNFPSPPTHDRSPICGKSTDSIGDESFRSTMSSQRATPTTATTYFPRNKSDQRHSEHSSFRKLQKSLSVMAKTPSDGIVLWLPRVSLHWLALWLLLSAAVSASPSDLYSTAPHASSLKRSPSDSYMKPSQLFNRYFSCRYALQPPSHPAPSDDTAESEDGQVWQQPQQSSPNGTWRHSKRQNLQQRNRLHKKFRMTCPADCDGIIKWDEAASNTVQHISCLDVFKSVQQMPSKVIVEEIEMSTVGGEQLDGELNGANLESTTTTIDPALNEPVFIEDFMHTEKKLASVNATRRCDVDGSWELQADYTKCGLESRRLFVLTPQQLDKIYDIREKMINSKFTRLPESEKAFVDCIDTVLSQPPSQLPEPFCERTFDGWTCFNDTPASQVVYFKCPDFIYGFNSQNEAHKTCTAEGKWKVHRETLVPWTNYTSCVDIPDFHFRNMIIKLHIIGYSISLLALLISLGIFFAFKTLSSQTRIRIHKNFFVSFIINNFMWIIWYFVITDQKILLENGLYCQSLHVLLHYFLLCNYFWMFCEGCYLHTILVVAFVSEEKILKWFYFIGWGIPVLFATAYAVMRGNSPDTQNCWIDESEYTWILNMPVLLSFLLNIFFLVNIVRVLVTKLQAVNTADTHQTRKAARATLILIPLLGLHFILTPFRPESKSSAAQAYEVFSAAVSSLQGFCVAMLFCFFNGEVLSHIRKRWNQFLLVHGFNSDRRMSYGGTTVSFLSTSLSRGDSRQLNRKSVSFSRGSNCTTPSSARASSSSTSGHIDYHFSPPVSAETLLINAANGHTPTRGSIQSGSSCELSGLTAGETQLNQQRVFEFLDEHQKWSSKQAGCLHTNGFLSVGRQSKTALTPVSMHDDETEAMLSA